MPCSRPAFSKLRVRSGTPLLNTCRGVFLRQVYVSAYKIDSRGGFRQAPIFKKHYRPPGGPRGEIIGPSVSSLGPKKSITSPSTMSKNCRVLLETGLSSPGNASLGRGADMPSIFCKDPRFVPGPGRLPGFEALFQLGGGKLNVDATLVYID